MSLARLTAVEVVRRPLCLLLTMSCIILTALTPLLLMHTFGEAGKLARDSGLACHFVFGLFIAGYAAGSSLAREIRSGTAAAVLSKPVGRGLFFLSKFAGLAMVVIGFSFCATLATLLSERVAVKYAFTGRLAGHIVDWQTGNMLLAAPLLALLVAALINYFTRKPFQSLAFGILMLLLVATLLVSGLFDRAGDLHPYSMRVQWRIVPASILITLALLTLSAMAMALSSRLSTVPTITACFLVFLLGLMSDFLVGQYAGKSVLAHIFYGLLPNWQHFWVVDALNNGGRIPWVYVLRASVYAGVYSTGMLCLGALSFRHTEVT